MNPELKAGDIFFVDSDKIGPRIVKFLMSSPTIWHWLLGKLLGLFNKNLESKFISSVRFYHAGLIINNVTLIEQQWKVQVVNTVDKILTKKHVVWRKKGLTDEQRESLVTTAHTKLDKTYDVLLLVGKTLAYITGIPLFRIIVQQSGHEICPTFVGWVYWKTLKYQWAGLAVSSLTTDLMDDYHETHPDEWERVSIKEE